MDVFNQALKNPLPPVRRENASNLALESPTQRNDDPKRALSTPHETDNENSTINNGFKNNDTASKDNSNNVTSDDDTDQYRKRKSLRRKHRNSHLGCGTCKKRRIKCDENLPQCFNCVKGKLHCAYLNLDAPARNALRMAQYNQNLRQDGSKDKKDDKKEVVIPAPMPGQLHLGQLPPQLTSAAQAPVSGHNGQYPAFVPYHIVPHPAMAQDPLQMGSLPQIISQQASGMAQAPYAHLVSFQPVGTVAGAVAYSPMPVQVVPQQVPVVYHTLPEDHSVKIPPLAAPQYQQVPVHSSSNLPLVKNQSYSELMVAMGHYPPPNAGMATPAPPMAESKLMSGPPPSVPLLDPACFSSASRNQASALPKLENEPVKLPIIQTNDNSATHSAAHSTSASAVQSYAHSKAPSAASSSATSPVLQGDKAPAILKLLS